jgi:ADP-heptose:LPS heptosyltransferase
VHFLRKVFKNLITGVIPNLGSKRRNFLESPRAIALVNWENLGDFVLFTSVIRETKRNFPNAKLIVVAQKENKELANECSYVDKWVWVKGHRDPKPGMGHGVETNYWKKLIVTYLALLFYGSRKIDLLIGPDWLLVKNSSQLRQNLLFRKGNRRTELLQSAPVEKLELFQDKSHQVTRMLSILEMFGLQVESDEIENWITPSVTSTEVDMESLQNVRHHHILISIGAGQARRSWPVESVKELVSSLEAEYESFQMTIVGPKSLVTAETIQAFPNSGSVRNLIGKTDLSSVVRLMQNSDLLISNDSGLVHIAASLKLPCVVVSAHPLNADPWHLHSPNRYHPWKTAFRVIQPEVLVDNCLGSCQATNPHCIKLITPTEVLKACNSLLTQKWP